MKVKLLLFLLFYLSTIIKAEGDSNPSNLVVWSKDGTIVAFKLLEKPKVTFTETDLVITSLGIEVFFPLEDFSRFTYEDDNTITAITNLQTDESPFKINGESLLFPSLKANSTVSVYSLNGIPLFSKTIQKDGEYSFSLSGMNNGFYLVTVNGLSYKIQKK